MRAHAQALSPTILGALAIIAAAGPALAAANVSLQPAQVTQAADGQQIKQSVTLANEVVSYTLDYDAVHLADRNEITSSQWAWTVGWVPLGMGEPSRPNWYYQGFFNWEFDDESLVNRPATARVVRGSGSDAMIEYTWDTPNASVSIRFAIVSASDKLLMFGHYEPKAPVTRSVLKLSCYPSFFEEPRERAVTTALGTRRPGEVVRLDLESEHWVLYEDTSAGRPGAGSAGLIIGAPQNLASVEIPVGAYGITTAIELAPEARDFALALYDFPPMPDYQQTRAYFARQGDAEAQALTEMLAGDLDRPLPPLPSDPERLGEVIAAGERLLDRPAEIWRPDPAPLDFPWAAQVPGGPLRSVIFCRRWEAWETMELARRLSMDARHMYWDAEDAISQASAWPYASATGIGPIPFGIAAGQAARLAADPEAELIVCAGLNSRGLPGLVQTAIMERVAAGAGLLIAGPRGWQGVWPQELFADEAPELAASVLAGFDWESIPGMGEGEPGRAGTPPVLAWRYGAGRVVLLDVNLSGFSSLAPRTMISEGILEGMDRWLGLVACAGLVAAGHDPVCTVALRPEVLANGAVPVTIDGAPQGAKLRIRLQDDLGRVLAARDLDLPLPGGAIQLPPLPPSRRCWLDAIVVDGAGATIGLASVGLPQTGGASIADLAITPSTRADELTPPWVDLPNGGEVQVRARVETPRALDGAELRWEVRDVFDRVIAQATTPVPPGGGEASAALTLTRPVTVCHLLDVTLVQGDTEVDFARRRFTMTVPYPYEDFTALMWTTTGGSPVLQRTDRLCYEWGTEMCDPANTLRADAERAAREHAITAWSGMRLVPYVTRIFSEANPDGVRQPSLSDPEYLSTTSDLLATNARQAAPYQPAAYTLGDENMLFRGRGELGRDPAAIAHFQRWLQERYGTIAALNAAWATNHAGFGAIEPMGLEEALARAQDDGAPASLAPWIDHRAFLDHSFAEAHRTFASAIRGEDPGAKVGWDGLLGWNWQAGYDFVDLTDGLDLNQTYISQWLQGEMVRAFKGPGALTGKWGNRVADNEAGWTAFPWACLFKGDQSAWWWTSWGCDYVPFNPDLSQSQFGAWFFRAVAEVAHGPGRLLLHGERVDSPVGMLFEHRNIYPAVIAGQTTAGAPWAGDRAFLTEMEALLKGVQDLGCQPTSISSGDLAAGLDPARFRVFMLPYATCLSDEQVAALTVWVEAGGTLVVDGRAGLLTGDGAMRAARPLDDLLGVTSVAGREGFLAAGMTATISVDGELAGGVPLVLDAFDVRILEPGLQVTTGRALADADGVPVLVVNAVGQGRTVLLNFAMDELNAARAADGPQPRLAILDAVLRSAGVEPFAAITRPDGTRPLCTHQALFTDGAARYLMVQQDILQVGLPDQPVTITLPEPAVVYDVRAGERIGDGPVTAWEATLGRGNPLVYALLPYAVTGVALGGPDSTDRGAALPVEVTISADANALGYHVARLDVYAPGADTPHRQYSQNVDCFAGRGRADIPFALSDPAGAWRLVARDAASGTATERTVQVR